MSSFAQDHLRFLEQVDGTWWPGLIFGSYVKAQTVLETLDIEGLEGFSNMNDELAKLFLKRLSSKQPTTGRVVIVLGGDKKIVWEEAIGEPKSFYILLGTLMYCAKYKLNQGWNNALAEAHRLLCIPRVPAEHCDFPQVESVTNQEVVPPPEGMVTHAGDTKQPDVTPADSAPVQSQSTSMKGVAVAVNKKAASKLKKKQVPRKKTKEPPKSLLRSSEKAASKLKKNQVPRKKTTKEQLESLEPLL
jgi:hypothetical protein